MGLFFLGIVLFECHLLDEKWRVARDRGNFIASRTYSVLLVTETEMQNGKHRLKAFIDLAGEDLDLAQLLRRAKIDAVTVHCFEFHSLFRV